jgi:tetratricopeptide (TPR) repeat protein
MKSNILYILLLFISTNCYSQKCASDYLEEGRKFIQSKQYSSALASFKYIKEHFRDDKLYPKAMYDIAWLYYEQGSDSSIDAAKEILKTDFKIPLEVINGTGYPAYSDYKNDACHLLYRIYYDKKDYNQALVYLHDADTLYHYSTFCSEGYDYDKVFLATNYALCYEHLGQDNKAITTLLGIVFLDYVPSQRKAMDTLKRLLYKKYTAAEVSDALGKAISSIQYRPVTKNGNTYTEYYFRFADNDVVFPYWRTANSEAVKSTCFYKMLQYEKPTQPLTPTPSVPHRKRRFFRLWR